MSSSWRRTSGPLDWYCACIPAPFRVALVDSLTLTYHDLLIRGLSPEDRRGCFSLFDGHAAGTTTAGRSEGRFFQTYRGAEKVRENTLAMVFPSQQQPSATFREMTTLAGKWAIRVGWGYGGARGGMGAGIWVPVWVVCR